MNCFILFYVPDLKTMGSRERRSNRQLEFTQELLMTSKGGKKMENAADK
jgi:hypothetical protein